MKPGNLFIQGAKSGGETKDEDSERHYARSESVGALIFVGTLCRGRPCV